MLITTNSCIQQHVKKYIIAVIIPLLMMCLAPPVMAQAKPGKSNSPQNGKMKIVRHSGNYRGTKIKFVEITTGYGIWATSPQTGFRKTNDPVYGSLEYGNTLSPVSYGISAVTNTYFQRDSISIQSRHGIMYGKYRWVYPLDKKSTAIELHLIAGVQGWNSKLDNLNTDQTEFSIPGGQKDSGVGMALGAGLQFRYRNIGVGGQFLWLSGKATYKLADGSDVGVLTGSKQLDVILSYRIVWGHKKVKCPIYSK